MASNVWSYAFLVAIAFVCRANCHLRMSELDSIDYFLPDPNPEEVKNFELSISEPVDVTSYAIEGESECQKGSGNTDDYVDQLLSDVRPHIPEPLSLPGREGRFKLFDGALFGLKSLKRSGPAMVRCTEDTFSFHSPVSLTNLTGNYLWELTTAWRVFNGTVDMALRDVEGDILYTRYYDSQGQVTKAEAEKVTVTRLEGAEVEFTGLGPLTRIASRFSNFVARKFRSEISRSLEGPIRDLVNRELGNVEKYQYYY